MLTARASPLFAQERPGADAILKSDYVRHHVERYAAHVMDLGLGLAAQGRAGAGQQGAEGAAAGGGKSAAAAAAAALGLAGLCVSEARWVGEALIAGREGTVWCR